jgi:hypothetical protein
MKTNIEKAQEAIKDHFGDDLYDLANADIVDKEEVVETIDALKESFEDLEKEYKEKIGELEEIINQYEEDNDYTDQIRTVDVIHWKTGNLMDSFVMEALSELYETYSANQILDKLTSLKQKESLALSPYYVDDLL